MSQLADRSNASDQHPGAPTVASYFDAMKFGRPHVLVGLGLFIAFVLQTWEQLALVYVADDLGADLGTGEAQIGWVLSAVAMGMIPGVLIWGPVADRIGRRRVCIASLASYGIITATTALAPNIEWLIGTRFIAGVAFAGVYTVTFPLFLELLPTHVRGRATVYLSAGWPVGILVAVGASYALSDFGWRSVALASALAGLWLFAIRAWVPESPYWLAEKGRLDEARSVLNQLGAHVPATTQLAVPPVAIRSKSLFAPFRSPLTKITVFMLIVNFTFNWGYWGLQTWLPTLLQERGLSGSSSLGFVALSALFMFPGYVTASWLTGRYGRRPVFLVYVAAAAVSGFAFAFVDTVPQLYTANFCLAFFSLGAWGVWNTWNGEFFPTQLRVTGVSWALAAQLVSTSIAPSTIGFLLGRATGFSATVVFINAFLVVAIIFAIGLPETEGKSLD